ncbi:unnamed protein product [Caretta caretta]
MTNDIKTYLGVYTIPLFCSMEKAYFCKLNIFSFHFSLAFFLPFLFISTFSPCSWKPIISTLGMGFLAPQQSPSSHVMWHISKLSL